MYNEIKQLGLRLDARLGNFARNDCSPTKLKWLGLTKEYADIPSEELRALRSMFGESSPLFFSYLLYYMLHKNYVSKIKYRASPDIVAAPSKEAELFLDSVNIVINHQKSIDLHGDLLHAIFLKRFE